MADDGVDFVRYRPFLFYLSPFVRSDLRLVYRSSTSWQCVQCCGFERFSAVVKRTSLAAAAGNHGATVYFTISTAIDSNNKPSSFWRNKDRIVASSNHGQYTRWRVFHETSTSWLLQLL